MLVGCVLSNKMCLESHFLMLIASLMAIQVNTMEIVMFLLRLHWMCVRAHSRQQIKSFVTIKKKMNQTGVHYSEIVYKHYLECF